MFLPILLLISASPYRAGQRGAAVGLTASGRRAEAVLALLVMMLLLLFAVSVAPVAAHPLGEVPVIVLLVVHDERGEQPERQLGGLCGGTSGGS